VSFSRPVGLKGPATIAIAAATLTAFAMAASGSAQAEPAQAQAENLYIVQIAGSPLASYTGGVAGIPATKPADGQKVNMKAWNSKEYLKLLQKRRAEVKSKAGVDTRKTVAEYDTAFNGFAVSITGAQAAKLSATPGVVRVWKNEMREVDTISTPKFLGLEGPGGTWARQFGGQANAGKGIIVGVVDTGYWPENPSFAPLANTDDQAIIDAKWIDPSRPDKCDEGIERPVACNNKVIGARYYNATPGISAFEGEFISPRDYNGHGSHTASTAAGNANVTAVINGKPVGTLSGMAPAARIAVYKALWQQAGGTGSGGTVDLVNAIDDAVADGVDVLNYSISGSRNSVLDPTEVAFFNAAAAGVFVAASAGNTPGASNVAHNSPWITTVAASTHDRTALKTVTLGNGKSFEGPGLDAAVPSAGLVDAIAAGANGATPAEAELCTPGKLDPSKVTGKIVLCARGVIGRTDKSKAVKDAGGVGMVLYNKSAAESLNADYHFVPTVHVGPAAGAEIKAYIASAGANATASLSEARPITARAPEMAAFSSPGPALAGAGDLLKPDITAPGVDVVAAVAPPGNSDNNFQAYSGTSMSSPHIAGIAALIRSKNPAWSPMAVKSAMMTTATPLDNQGKPIQRGGADANPLDYGNGHVRPGEAFDPGLVFESNPVDWFQYACGINQPFILEGEDNQPINTCDIFGKIDPSDLNTPSIAIGDLAGKQTVTRTVTNVSNRTSVYVPRVQAPAGFSVKVTPSTLSVPAGRSASFRVEFTRTDAAFGKFSFGSLIWTDLRGHNVRSALAVRAVPLAAPAEVRQTGVSGNTSLSVRPGYAGTLTSAARGLVEGAVTAQNLTGTNGSFPISAPVTGPAVMKVDFTIPAGTKLGRVATFDSDYAAGSDLDLYVYRNGALVGQSGGGTSEENVDLGPGTYSAYVVQFATPAGVNTQNAKVNVFALGNTATGNLTVTPPSQAVTTGGAANVSVSWTGLTAGRHYLGGVEFGNGSASLGMTIVSIDA
jgi:subtilisin family serine protease